MIDDNEESDMALWRRSEMTAKARKDYAAQRASVVASLIRQAAVSSDSKVSFLAAKIAVYDEVLAFFSVGRKKDTDEQG